MAGPLQGIKVLDFSMLLPGPYATLQLADMGADVLKIEAPHRPDLVREMAPLSNNTSTAHRYLNRSKRSLSLDLKKSESVKIVQRLLGEYDIIVEQFRPGVMDRLGLGYSALRSFNQALIYCSITGYGQTGPWRNKAGHDINYLSLAGITSYAHKIDNDPSPYAIQIADIAGGSLQAAIAILAAIVYRNSTGIGQYIDISITDGAFALNALEGAAFLGGGREPKPEQTLLNGGTFYGFYKTQDGKHLSIAPLEAKFFQKFCQLIGQEKFTSIDLDDRKSQIELKSQIKNVIKSKTLQQWLKIFADSEVCVEPVLSFAQSCEHAQIQARELVVQVPEGPIESPVQETSQEQQLACPLRFSECENQYRWVGPPLGEHNLEVLLEHGYSASEYEKFKQAGVFG